MDIASWKTEDIPKEIVELAEKREIARKNKDWENADELRKKIIDKGFIIDDTPKGYVLSKNLFSL